MKLGIHSLDGEVTEIDAFGKLVLVGVAHRHPDVDAVATPGSGERYATLTVFTGAAGERVDCATLGRVEDKDHCLVVGVCVVDSAVVGPADVQTLAVDYCRRRVGQQDGAFRDSELVVKDLVVRIGTAYSVRVVEAVASRTCGHRARAEGLFDEAVDFVEEVVKERELCTRHKLLLGLGVLGAKRFAQDALKVVAELLIADGGAELTREGVH